MIDYYYEQLNFTERRIYKSIYVSIVNKESYVYIAHIKKENLEKIYIGISYGPYLLGKLTNRCSAVGISPQPVGN